MDKNLIIEEQLPWILIDKYFNDNPSAFVSHHLESYNAFFQTGIKNIFKEKNPIRLLKEEDPDTHEFNLKCDIYMGGKEGNKLYYGKPVIFDEEREHYMYPNEARLRNMTYGISIHYDVEVEFTMMNPVTKKYDLKTITLEKMFLGRFPIMLQSNLCILNGLDKKTRFELGECRNDHGGYFIIDGKEKCIISQEKFADNMIYIKDDVNDLYSHSAEIRSVSEDASKPIRTLAIKIVRPSTTLTNNQIVVNIPNVRKPVPLFILMRALGIPSDKAIIEMCLLDLDRYESYIDLFIPSIHDAGQIFNQDLALEYIASFTKKRTITSALEILTNYLLPHIGEMTFLNKAYFIGYMVKQLLNVFMNDSAPTDRDNFRFKRVELPGSLLYDLFKEYYTVQQHELFLKIDKEFFYKKKEGSTIYLNDFPLLITQNYKEFFAERKVESGFRKAFKGSWGAEEHTKRIGVVQDVNRLSYNSFMSLLRKISLPLDASAKIVKPRLLHASQWGIIDPIDTPDGGNVGLHKHMTIISSITSGCSAYPIIKWLKEHTALFLLNETTPKTVAAMCKVIVNGNWIGVINEPQKLETQFKAYRRLALLPTFISIQWNIKSNTIFIYTDAGRLCRPIYYIDEKGLPSYMPVLKQIIEKADDMSWQDLITGFAKKKNEAKFAIDAYKIYADPAELYAESDMKALLPYRAIIDYMDTSEAESSLIAFNPDQLKENALYTHLEIHPSFILGFMGNQVVFPENNQLPRDLFACGQAKQAVSLYHSNYQVRMDKMGVVLNNGQIPLIKSRYLKYINEEEHPCGENTIVAIMCLNGYNVEDSILFNEGALKRGLFRTTYFTTYESREETESTSTEKGKMGTSTMGSSTNSYFANIENIENKEVVGLKKGFDYSALDQYGLIKENTYVNEETVLIGKVTEDPTNAEVVGDASTVPKKGQEGYVDRTFITEGEQGRRIAKVRVRSERIPNIGDKFSSRCGQKGTVGIVIPEEDMPFTDYGIRPDIIINPHAIPSRMTIGQLLETVMGKACSIYGAFGDCTAFVNKGPKHKIFGELLVNEGFHSSGNELLYNGQTGEQLEAQIFMGPTYYMRLKHMVKDKINYRAKGPRTVLTRQTVQGRANDGGLRIGEMERDGLISHGITNFLKESMLVRGDDYYMAICNKTGTIAVYNSSSNIFISPFADGPLKYTESLDTQTLNIENVTRFGRSFSIIRVPYAFKLLYQELQTMNIQMRIITEDNIDQLAPMSFSNSKENTVKNVKNVYEGIRKYMQRKEKQKKALPALPALPPPQPPKELSAIEQAAKSAMALFYPAAAPEQAVKANLPSPQEYYGNVPVFYDSVTGKYEKYVSPESVEKGVTEKVSDFADSSLASVSQMADTAKMSAQQVIDSVTNTKNSAFNMADQAKASALNQMNATANSVTGFADSSLASVTQMADTAKMSAQQVMNGVSSAKDSALIMADQAKTSVINQMNATSDSLKNNVSNARAYASNAAADASAKATDFVASTSAKATDFASSTSAKASNAAADASAKASEFAASTSSKASGIAADASAKASDLAAKTSARATTLAKAANDLASSLSAQASNMSASLAENTGTQFSNFKEYMNTSVIEPLSLLTTIQPEKTSGGGSSSDAGVTKTVRM
jgi:DNA-directed RNA polymerase II subunit RPB2